VAVSMKKAAELCDMPDSTVETLLTVMELPPFELLLVEGVHLDVIQGSFRVPRDKLSKLATED
jgi:hypothetical protein